MLPSPMLNMSSNGLPDSMPFYFKECTSASASSSSQYTNSKQMHGRGIERKLSSTSIASKQPPNNMHPEIPLRFQPLFEDADRISDPETLKRWVEEFMPKPEPPRFFRPLCSRLARENQVLDEQMGHYVEKSNKHIEELRRRLNMSIRQVREEQKVELNRLKQERERASSDSKKDEKHQQTLRRDSSSNLPIMDEKAVVAAATPNHHRHHPHSASTSSQQRCNNHSCSSAGELAKEKNGRKERKDNNGRRRESRWDRKESHYHPERGVHKEREQYHRCLLPITAFTLLQQQKYNAVRYVRVASSMPHNQQHQSSSSNNGQVQQQTSPSHSQATAAVNSADLRNETTDDEFEGDETSVLIKHPTKPKDQKKAERTPLLDYHAERKRAGMLSPTEEPPGSRSERANTADSQQSDDEMVRICNEQYGSTSGEDFAACLVDAIRAINHGTYPERIPQGSSGSYFVKNMRGEKTGVFKPKNEEPYGILNPKWIKWLHKLFFPCCFGRSCLVPNQGYLSEAGASLVDQKLGLNVVPKTAVVSLAAPTFNYSRVDRAMARTKERIRDRYPEFGRHFRRVGLPPKRGSFQLFVNGYKDATYWLRQWELYPEMAPPPPTLKEFQLEFEQMVILDYIIRNTDRGNDNWLIQYEVATTTEQPTKAGKEVGGAEAIGRQTSSSDALKEQPGKEPAKFADDGKLIDIHDEGVLVDKETKSTTKSIENTETESTTLKEAGKDDGGRDAISECWESVDMPHVKIAAIDNGLAFPFKHPDQWRAYPYRWANLPMAQRPFNEETVQKILPLLDNTDFVRDLGNGLRKIFETDPGFDKKTFAKQLSVIRGQMFNLREALRTRKSPAQLVQMTPQYMIEIKKKKRRKLRRDLAKSFGGTSGGTVVTVDSVATRTTITEQPIGAKLSNRGEGDGESERTEATLVPDTHALAGPSTATTTTTTITVIRPAHEEEVQHATILTEDEMDDPKSWYNTFQQKVQTRSPFFAMW